MRDADLAATFRHLADRLDDLALLNLMLANIDPYARGGVFTEAQLANVTRAQVQTVNNWRKRGGSVGGVVVASAAKQDTETADNYLELAAFKSTEERLMDVRQRVDAVLGEVTRHVIALEERKRYRKRAAEERLVADMIGEIWGELARVRLLMRESGE